MTRGTGDSGNPAQHRGRTIYIYIYILEVERCATKEGGGMVCCTAAEGREGSIVEKRKKRNGCLGIIICSLVLYYRSTTSIARLRFSQYIKRFTQKKASSLDATQREDVPADDCLNHRQRNLYFFFVSLFFSHSTVALTFALNQTGSQWCR